MAVVKNISLTSPGGRHFDSQSVPTLWLTDLFNSRPRDPTACSDLGGHMRYKDMQAGKTLHTLKYLLEHNYAVGLSH